MTIELFYIYIHLFETCVGFYLHFRHLRCEFRGRLAVENDGDRDSIRDHDSIHDCDGIHDCDSIYDCDGIHKPH